MKLNLKSLALMALLMGSTSAFAQLNLQDNTNDRTRGLYDGEEVLSYSFPKSTDFKLIDERKKVILEGTGDSAELGVLIPGTYWMLFEREDGKMIMDRFEVAKK